MLRLKKEEYELLEAAIKILRDSELSSQERSDLLSDFDSAEEKATWAIVMDSGDVLEYEDMVPELSRRACENNCAAACRISCITGCNSSCKSGCKGSCNSNCGNAYRTAAGQ